MRPNSEPQPGAVTLLSRLRRSLTRYDLVLTVIPVALLVTVGAAELFGLPNRAALAGGALVGLVALADALFWNPPTAGGRRN
jgi:predicted Kef-type K+ transport protein